MTSSYTHKITELFSEINTLYYITGSSILYNRQQRRVKNDRRPTIERWRATVVISFENVPESFRPGAGISADGWCGIRKRQRR